MFEIVQARGFAPRGHMLNSPSRRPPRCTPQTCRPLMTYTAAWMFSVTANSCRIDEEGLRAIRRIS
jgi:hypothetical protein